jgi:hypothetical protein
VDAYHLPLIPVEPSPEQMSPPTPETSSGNASPPVARESNP